MKEKLKYLPLVLKLFFLIFTGIVLYRNRGTLFRFCRYPFPFIMCPVCDYPCFFYRYQERIALGVIITGLVSGRIFCGMACPVGTVQDWLHSLKRWVFSANIFAFKGLTASLGKFPGTLESTLRFLKYPLLLLVFVYSLIRFAQAFDFVPDRLVVPAMILTLQVREAAGSGYINFWLFFLVIVFGLGLVLHRPWCKYLCPVGLLFATLNKISLLKIKLGEKAYAGRRKYLKDCTTGKPLSELEKGFASVECIRCYNCVLTCSEGAVKLKAGGRG